MKIPSIAEIFLSLLVTKFLHQIWTVAKSNPNNKASHALSSNRRKISLWIPFPSGKLRKDLDSYESFPFEAIPNKRGSSLSNHPPYASSVSQQALQAAIKIWIKAGCFDAKRINIGARRGWKEVDKRPRGRQIYPCNGRFTQPLVYYYYSKPTPTSPPWCRRGSWRPPDKGGFLVWIENRFVFRRFEIFNSRHCANAPLNATGYYERLTRGIKDSWLSSCEQINTLSSISIFEDVNVIWTMWFVSLYFIFEKYIHCEEYEKGIL